MSNTDTTNDFGTLCNYLTGEAIRPATWDERCASLAMAKIDGGAVFFFEQKAAYEITCYVED